jgi:stress response protein SCP2
MTTDGEPPVETRGTVQHRSSQASAVERKRADGAIKPFIGALKAWNGKVARLRGLASSVYSTEEDKVLARLECGALLAEIRRRHSEFRSAIKGEPPHGRLDDVEAAFGRLIQQLQEISVGRDRAN